MKMGIESVATEEFNKLRLENKKLKTCIVK